MRQFFRRVPVPSVARQPAQFKTFPAPVRGLVLNENLATSRVGGAAQLDNWRPTSNGIALRGGSALHATVGAGSVDAMMAYDGFGLRQVFAGMGTGIFDVTTPASPTVPPAAAVTGQTSAYYASAQMTTTGGAFLMVVNGADDMQRYDGAVWLQLNSGSTPAVTGVNTSDLSHVWVYRNRLFFVEVNTFDFWYFAVDSVAGALTKFSLSGVFKLGGSLLFGATWSMDAGDGLDDKCVFVSTNGEAAVYEGGNPSDAADWRLVGTYEVGRPLGKNVTMRAGGDLLIATEEGLAPLSQAISKDRAALSMASVSRPIAPDWSTDAGQRILPWGVVKWPAKKIAVIAIPTSTGQEKKCRVVHLETGAWATYTGWDMRSVVEIAGRVFFGTSDGKVIEAERGGSDNGLPYTCTAVLQFDHFGQPGPVKTVRMARATFVSTQAFIAKLSASANYAIRLPSVPQSTPDVISPDTWDNGLWDVAVWDATGTKRVTSKWVSIGLTGFSIAMQVQVTCGVTQTPDAELVSIDTTYETGATVV